jgi:hypothetical protein
MDEATRKEVERAWAVDERCRPTVDDPGFVLNLSEGAWELPHGEWCTRVYVSQREIEHDCYVALHTAILQRGWQVHAPSPQSVFVLRSRHMHEYAEPTDRGVVVAHGRSAISAMARAIVAGNGEKGPQA